MKHLKVLGLAVVAAAAMMAIFGASSASAVQICKVGVTGDGKCATTNNEAEYDGEITATSTNPVLTTNVATVTCEHSATTVDPDSSTGEPSIGGTVTALSFTGNCKTGSGTKCEVTVHNIPYEGSVTSESMVVEDTEGAGATVKCGFLINCKFTSTEVELSVKHSGDNTIVSAEDVPLTRSGGFCPETSTWDADYTASNITID